MKNWEKNKKDTRRSDDREQQSQHFHDHKKKKLKPVEKSKYRMKSAYDDEE
ncbi:MAG: hypothetical protein JNJ57_17895 [Saprospiraceae bacterium]|nr:hypothetical protein [Saprospiraceae bacterium]